MKWTRFIWITVVLALINQLPISANDGNSFSINYLPNEYKAHNRNFDIVGDNYGRIFVANFEGLLYFDQAEWRILHSPGIFRFTKLYKDHNGRIWCGGYNFFGYLTAHENGELALKTVFSHKNKGLLGEVTDITEENGKICVYSSLGKERIKDTCLDDYVVRKAIDNSETFRGTKVNAKVRLSNGTEVLGTAGAGIIQLDINGKIKEEQNEANGLCNNNVNALYVDSLDNVWGATDDGIFLSHMNSTYTKFGESEGLIGEVHTICQTEHALYVGTLQGLFYREGKRFYRLPGIRNACWQLQKHTGNKVFACTAAGLFLIDGTQIKHLSNRHTFSVYPCENGGFYTGEADGVYYYPAKGERRQVNSIEKAENFIRESDDLIWIRNVFGQVYQCSNDMKSAQLLQITREKGPSESSNIIVYQQNGSTYFVSYAGFFRWDKTAGQLVSVESKNTEGLTKGYPQLVYPEGNDRIWFTDKEGKQIKVISQSKTFDELNAVIYPLHALNIRTMTANESDWWWGGHFGLIHCNPVRKETDFQNKPVLSIRSIVLDNDSVIWGGFNRDLAQSPILPFRHISFESNVREIVINFSTTSFSTLGKNEYCYRINKKRAWSNWSPQAKAIFSNPRPGTYEFEVMARNRYGYISEPVMIHLNIAYPFFLRWYAWVSYAILLGVSIFFFIKWRMRRLINEKRRLESIVENRTSQIRQQKDEIEEKSKNLEQALNDLEQAQYELIRQEKMATVGTLTQGLVDRILNPMNYVNNFSHMSIGLVNDLKENMEDDEEKMTPDIFEDSMDVIDMLDTNLKKIEEHGMNTTKILKAMEEMLKERHVNKTSTDLVALCKMNMKMLQEYSSKDIADCHIQLDFVTQESSVMVQVDAEQISRTIMSSLNNSIYAVRKKYTKAAFDAIVRLTIEANASAVNLKIYDNGIGIEESILDKIFDPFFTTKTTAEAVGVGMYMSKEVILNHGGEIKVQSTKDEYTEFIITLPVQPSEDKA